MNPEDKRSQTNAIDNNMPPAGGVSYPPSGEPTQPMPTVEPPAKKPGGNMVLLLVAVVLALAGVVIYLFMR